MVDVVKEKCMGCQQCADVCPVHAIEYEIKNGFRYPKINDNCIGCELCERKCPALNDLVNHNKQPIVYAAWTQDDKQRLESTSGGMNYQSILLRMMDMLQAYHGIIIFEMQSMKSLMILKD